MDLKWQISLSLLLMTLCSLSQPAEAELPSDPYKKFLAEQKKRNREWKSEREARRAKVESVTPAVKQNDASSADRDRRPEDPVTLLRQQLATQADECRELRNKLESIEAANARILKNQMEMQENFVKVMFLKVILLNNSSSVRS